MVPAINILGKRAIIGIALLLLIFGCSSPGRVQPQPIKPLKPAALPAGDGWWYARFRLNWPADTEPLWYPDLFIAHQVISPVLKQYQKDILLWRFHRRAARDAGGRQFSFIFYCSAATAEKIFTVISADAQVNAMKSAGVIDQVVCDRPEVITRPHIEDTSDKSWSPAIQKSWPYYIMGASRMWLNLIAEVAAQNLQGAPPATLPEIEIFYQKVDKAITDLWQRQGRHAFMHHLNALFGYKPLIYWQKQYMTF